MILFLLLSLAGALLLWKLAYCRLQPDAEGPRPSTRRIRVLGAMGLVLQLPVLVGMGVAMLNGQLPDLSSKVLGIGMLVLPAFFALLGLRLLFGRFDARQ
ncbi:MAG: hypothetical protein AB7E32_00150 [Desulfovibrio sp.]